MKTLPLIRITSPLQSKTFLTLILCTVVYLAASEASTTVFAPLNQTPAFSLDKSWPKPLPNDWALGIVWAVAVDEQDHVWVLHETDRYLDKISKAGKTPAPPVVEFDQNGNLLQAWGGRDQGKPWVYKMPPHPLVGEHGLNVDYRGNIWITGGGHLALKFTRTGEFLLQIGQLNMTNGSNDTRYLGNPSGVDFDPDTKEIYIADGYLNKRIIVFDAETGEYKRHWGRLGHRPDDEFEAGQPFPRFAHGVQVAHDKLVYVSDREHNTIHVHKTDGTFLFNEKLSIRVNSVAFSSDAEQRYLYAGGMRTGQNGRYDLASDGTILILRRSDLTILGSFTSSGQHFFDVDSLGNIFTCGRFMPQKFVLSP